MSRRVFIAINLPGEIKGEIHEQLSNSIPEAGCKVVPGENLHITMLFLGYLGGEKIGEVKEKMEALGANKFWAVLSGIGEFNARVFWVGVEDGNRELKEIHDMLADAIGIDDKRFHSHVTLARNKTLDREEAGELVKILGRVHYTAKIRVESIDLMESVPKKTGPEYSVLFRAFLS